MAWNVPGGSGAKDPWSGRGGEQGPPDLDEMLRRLQNRLGGLFGRGPGGAGAAGGAPAVGLILGVILAVWFFSGIYIVDEGKRGVVLQFGAYKETMGPVPHWFPRFVESVNVVDVESIRSIELGLHSDEGLMLTQDENLVDIKFAVQYRIKEDATGARDFVFNNRRPTDAVGQVAESVMREVVGSQSMDQVLYESRQEIADSVRTQMQEILAGKARMVVREAVALTPSEIAEGQILMMRPQGADPAKAIAAKDRVLQDMLLQKQQRALQAYQEALKSKIPIKIHRELL